MGSVTPIEVASQRCLLIRSATPARRAFPQDVQHLLLQVHRDDVSGRPHEFRQGNRKQAHTAPHVHDRHPRTYVGTEDCRRVVDEPPQAVVDEVAAPPRTNVPTHDFPTRIFQDRGSPSRLCQPEASLASPGCDRPWNGIHSVLCPRARRLWMHMGDPELEAGALQRGRVSKWAGHTHAGCGRSGQFVDWKATRGTGSCGFGNAIAYS